MNLIVRLRVTLHLVFEFSFCGTVHRLYVTLLLSFASDSPSKTLQTLHTEF